MKQINAGIFNARALAIGAVVLWAGSAQASSILNIPGGLYSTGINGSGAMSVDNGLETHYTVRASTSTFTTPGAVADVATAYAYNGTYSGGLEAVTSLNIGSNNNSVAAGWLGYNTSGSSATGSGTGSTVNLNAGTVANNSTWISLGDTATGVAGSRRYYTYRTSFNLASVADLSSVHISGLWASDNRGKAIYLNGTLISSADFYGSTAKTVANYGTTSLAAFSIAGFNNLLVRGNNFFDFQVRNETVAATGIRVQFTTATVPDPVPVPVPEPESVALLAMGLAGMLVVRRRKA
jgi:hypothetical protein